MIAMLNARVTFVALVTFALASCAAGPYQVVWLPQRDADLYPLAQKQAGITIAIDEIKSPGRAERYCPFSVVLGENAGLLREISY